MVGVRVGIHDVANGLVGDCLLDLIENLLTAHLRLSSLVDDDVVFELDGKRQVASVNDVDIVAEGLDEIGWRRRTTFAATATSTATASRRRRREELREIRRICPNVRNRHAEYSAAAPLLLHR